MVDLLRVEKKGLGWAPAPLARATPYKQIVIAMGEGSKAALSAFDYLIRLPADVVEQAGV